MNVEDIFDKLKSAVGITPSSLPVRIRRCAAAFDKKRYAYFENMASMLIASDGHMNYLTLFEREAERYQGTDRGRLTAYWVERMHETGARLSESWLGSVPNDELAVIAIAERRGRGAVAAALADIARVGHTVASARKAFFATIAMALVGMTLAMSMILMMPFFFKPFFIKSFGFIPPEFYGPNTIRYYKTADFVGAVWWMVIPAVIAGAMWVAWSLPNWTGRARRWCDENIIIYKLYRDFKGALFLATLASLTKSSGGEVTNQRSALLMMVKEVQPWLRWKVEEMLSRMDSRGALDASIFDVGVVDKEIYYRITDIFEARGLSDGLEIAGRESEERAVSAIESRGKILRTVMLGGGVVTVMGLLFWVYGVVFEFKTAIGAWTNQ